MVAELSRFARFLKRVVRPARAVLPASSRTLRGAALSVSLMLVAPASVWSQAGAGETTPSEGLAFCTMGIS